jgi:hypothetical protein
MLTYTLETSASDSKRRAMPEDCIRLLLPPGMIQQLADFEQALLSYQGADGDAPSLLIKKDFSVPSFQREKPLPTES